MISFLLSVAALLVGFFFYSRVVERINGVQPEKPTPAITQNDGVDFVPMPGWKIFLIQFLNIAGLGPIFGAVAGAMWGPIAFVWIVFGAIFAGGVHDYFTGMLSLKHNGENITEISGYYLGNRVKQFMRGFLVVLMIIVGAVFIVGPAKILNGLSGDMITTNAWVWMIIAYYILSTVLPIDKLIGRVYPLFGFALLFMAAGITSVMIFDGLPIPELTWHNFSNLHDNAAAFPIFPMLFITIACGAVSGFHASQTPMMVRCLTNQLQARKIFYGAMITEGVLALIWAAVGMSFYGGVTELNDVMAAQKGNAAYVVNEISNSLLGKVGGILAILGVVAAPITSGDTSFRSARLIIADSIKSKQTKIVNRLLISFPVFLAAYVLTLVDFAVIWRYFAWSNQTLASIVLWVITVYLITERKNFWVSMVPAIFMTAVVTCYILISPEALALPASIAYPVSVAVALIPAFAALQKSRKVKHIHQELQAAI